MDLKRRPNHQRYIRTLRRMTPAQRLKKAMELSARVRRMFRQGLRRRFAHLGDEEFHRLYLERLEKCHNRNY